MNIAHEIVRLLSKEELRNFNLFASRTNARDDRKDLALVTAMRQETYDEQKIAEKLYPESDLNSFYRLKNRLVSDIGKSLLALHSGQNEFNDVLSRIMLGRIFSQKGNFSLAAKYFHKAEKLAEKAGFPELLELIYGELIRLSHESLEISPEDLIRKRKENRKQLTVLQEIDDVLAAVIYRIRSSQNFSARNDNVTSILEKTIRTYTGSGVSRKSPVLRMRIYQSVSRILLQKQDFRSLEEYLLKTYKEFESENIFNRSNHDIRLQLLVYLVNSLFKNGKYEESLRYTNVLKDALTEYDKVLYGKYIFYYYSGLIINYSVIDKHKAIGYLMQAMDDPAIRKAPANLQFIRLNLAVISFDIKDHRSALKHLVRIYNDAYFDKLDPSFRLKIFMAEIIIRFELNDIDFILHKITQLSKDFKDQLAQPEHKREKLMLDFISSALRKRSDKGPEARKLVSVLSGSEHNDVINYADWLTLKFPVKSKKAG